MMLSELEMVAAQAVYAAHAFERALHDRGPWTMVWGPHVAPATRTVGKNGVFFRSEFPELCWITRPAVNITLMCRDEVNAIRAIEFPGDAAFAVLWKLTVPIPERTSSR